MSMLRLSGFAQVLSTRSLVRLERTGPASCVCAVLTLRTEQRIQSVPTALIILVARTGILKSKLMLTLFRLRFPTLLLHSQLQHGLVF